jgi:tRNA-modifying protein YgfZ
VAKAPGEHPLKPGHYGSPLPEQRAFAAGAAVVDVSESDIVQVSGPDRLVWLDSLISQQVLGLQPDHTTESLILDPKGHIEHAFFVADDGVTTWLLTHPGTGEALFGWFTSMKFRMQVDISVLPRPYTVLAYNTPPGATALPEGVGEPILQFVDPWPQVGEGSVGYAPTPHPGEGWGVRYLVFDTQVPLAGLSLAGGLSLDALMIAAGRPSLADVDDKALPHEFDWLRTAVHLNKGCYRGQETVAKVHNLGHPPRRLTLLHLDGSQSQLPRPGEVVMLGEVEKGVITRAAWHFELGPIALALLKRSTPVDVPLTVISDGMQVAANQEILVPPDAGATREIPRIPRLGKRS